MIITFGLISHSKRMQHYIICIGTHQETARKVFLENPGLLADVGDGIMTENILSSV